ncbi:MAG: hypothetical protein JNL21_19515 [Myxococcales bacterium]|nr:hypothetical protein [Myxococcales bacterium]
MKHRVCPGRALVGVACLTLSLVACGDSKGGGATSAAASGVAASGSAAAKTETPKGDPAVVAELKKLSSCKREDGYRQECEATTAWESFRDKFVEEDDVQQTKMKKLVSACVEVTAEKDDSVREAGYECISSYGDGVADPKGLLATTIEKAGTETSAGVRVAMFSAIEQLDPTKQGMTAKLVALAKPLIDKDSGQNNLGQIVSTLVPRAANTEPAADAVALAFELLQKGKAHDPALRILERAKSKSAEACEAFAKLVETKKGPWARGTDSMSRMDGYCKDKLDRIVEVVVARAGEPEGYDKGFIGADVVYFQRLVETGAFNDAQKTKLRGAVEPLVKSATKDHQKESYEKLLAKLK